MMLLFNQLQTYLFLALVLFAIGLYGVLARRSLIAILISVELILNAASINFMAFNRFLAPHPAVGQVITLFIMAVAAAVIMIFTWRRDKLSLAISLTCSTIPVILAWSLFYKLHNAVTMAKPIITQVNWLVSDAVIVPFGFLLDPVSLLMLSIVATISWLIQIYSIGYMEGDPGFARYYADLSLFAMSMLSLVTASGMLQLFVSWELVGLASYLLIGFWYEKFSPSEAGKKAFVVTRFGDIGFLMGP